MRIKTLQPVIDDPETWDRIQAEILRVLRREIYLPLVQDAGGGRRVLKNDDRGSGGAREDTALLEALRSGQVTYYRGAFHGRMSARISRYLKSLGATFDPNTGSWQLPEPELPRSLQDAVRASEDRFQGRLSAIDSRLVNLDPDGIAREIDVKSFFDQALFRTTAEMDRTIKAAAITVPARLTPAMRDAIAHQWQEATRRKVKGFTTEQIRKLREQVRAHTLAGNRYEGLVKTIEKSYGISARRAKFIARQESRTLLSTFKEARYAEAQVYEYKWHCVAGSPAHPVRPRHKALSEASKNGTIFAFKNPPVTTEPGEPERRNNPGEDFNCRCVGIPVVRFK